MIRCIVQSEQVFFTRFSLHPESLALRLAVVACPFFFPTERISIGWAFPARLPLGAGFTGTCRAGLEEITPSEVELREFCNIGYAGGCSHMPADRCSDGVRFAIARDEESRIVLHYVSERFHEPVEYGRLEYDCKLQSWLAPHAESLLAAPGGMLCGGIP